MKDSKENGPGEQPSANPVEEEHDGETDNGQGETVERDLNYSLGDLPHLDVVRDKVSTVGLQRHEVIEVGCEDETSNG